MYFIRKWRKLLENGEEVWCKRLHSPFSAGFSTGNGFVFLLFGIEQEGAGLQ